MKKSISALLSILVLVPALAACTPAAPATTSGSASGTTTAVTVAVEKEMVMISPAEAAEFVGKEGYTILDIRKAADFEKSKIKGSIGADMDAAVQGDTEAGLAKIKEATKDLNDTLVLVCYSGKRYAQVTTNALNKLGYDMSKVVTIEGGFNEFIKVKPELVETK